MKTFHRVTAVTAAALLSASLAACSSTSPRNDSSGDSKDQESSAQPTAVSAQPAPAGYQMVTTSTSKISFAIPDNWQILSKDAAQDDQRVQAIADALGEVAVMTYTMTVQTTTVQGAVIAVRTKDGTWTLIWVSTSETSRAKELAGIITSTLS